MDASAQQSYEAANASRYRQYAEELRTIADDMVHERFRDTLLTLAQECMDMADNFEAIDRTNKAICKNRA